MRPLRPCYTLVKPTHGAMFPIMVTRGDIVWLGVSAGTTGGMIGGLMLGIGMDLAVNGQPLGLILVCIGAPASALIGWLLARRLAGQLTTE